MTAISLNVDPDAVIEEEEFPEPEVMTEEADPAKQQGEETQDEL